MLIVNWLGHLVFPGIFFSISNIGVMPSNFLCVSSPYQECSSGFFFFFPLIGVKYDAI